MLDNLEPVARLSKDLRQAATTLTDAEARYLVDAYYIMQDQRIRLEGQVRSMTASGEPHAVIAHLGAQSSSLEKQVQVFLEKYTTSHPVGQWLKTVKGIGPVLSAGLLAHVPIEQTPTAGSLWRFAGLDPSIKWRKSEYVRGHVAGVRKELKSDWLALLSICDEFERKPLDILRASKHLAEVPTVEQAIAACRKVTGVSVKPKAVIYADNVMREVLPKDKLDAGYAELVGDLKFSWKELTATLTKRPWNASLKVLAWKCGESFVKVSGGDEPGFYGLVYKRRKEWEQDNNEKGLLAAQAAAQLEAKNFRGDTQAKKCYEAGKLPPAHIHRRATRFTTKLFFSHFHHKLYENHYGKPPPHPYVIDHLGHGHYIAPPEAEQA